MGLLSRLSIRTRLLLATLVPVLLTAAAISFITVEQLRSNEQRQLAQLEESLLESRKDGLKTLVDVAKIVALEAKKNPLLSEREAKEAVANQLRAIRFGSNNYIYAYERTGSSQFINLAYAPDPSKEGVVSSPTTISIVRSLFDATNGDGFHGYDWPNPASGEKEPKLSYTVTIPDWDWMLGGGVYVTDIDQQLAIVKTKIDAKLAKTLGFIALATVVIVLLGVFVGVFVGRTVTRPLKTVSDLMEDIANGDGDLRKRLPAEGDDELAELGRCFNTFVIKIQETIRQVSATTDQVASAAEELSSVANETRASVQRQGSETDQIASAIHEMVATIQQISGNANDVESSASDADRMAREGGKTIASAQQAVHQLSDEIQASATTINSLAERSDNIQQVLDVIHAVTAQTNLLALNAAIEAARAGEHGRGFSVVADEVRQLARRSAESADQIREMIDGFVTESRAAVERMNQSRERSAETIERISHAAQALATIETSVGQIHDQVTQIATASEQQSQVAEEINQNVVRIVDAAQQSDTGVGQTHEASHELARLSESLRHLIGNFKV
ncbi:methyl-accepting chemotaxis protein [Marinobacter psychrophilus]|jgi:methyl-accepting chemotaxis protein|uniref:methyl-accepting chemotaxis protein n=1 Tax=Marinobacter psychrophilus TaxID=330734 RepID=UPI001B5EAC23|nr:methyl-accepting chemotaxis protein [Marinobacter psychrophilus]MBQ0761831.1 cache domain-containing protein [Marinobacter psychrophilus]MBQ0846489.1 cache domain-containing protein [Marinobacter psychrophilus]